MQEVHRDSLVNWVRFNHRDIPNALIYTGLCLLLLALAWGATELANHLLVTHVTSCCHSTGTLPIPKHSPIGTYAPP